MRRKYRRREYKQDILFDILLQHGNWDNTGDNEAARAALESFYKQLKKTKPNDSFSLGRREYYTNYIFYLIPIHKALQKKYYQRAANEIISLLHYECLFEAMNGNKLFLSQQIHANLSYLLQEYFHDTT